MDESVTASDGIIELHEDETKTIPLNFNEVKPAYAQFLYFACIFIYYYSINDSC